MKGIVTLLLLFTWALDASVVDHLKSAPGKNSSLHRLRNVDFIYMINLDKRPEKFKKSIDQLKPYGIVPYRFSAVNGWELSLEAINDVGVKLAPGMDTGYLGSSYLTPDLVRHDLPVEKIGQTYFVHCFARGTIGICLSHLSVLKDAYDAGYETIWVMEDDIDVIKDPRCIPELIERLDKVVGRGNWDILFTDRDFRNKKGEYVPCFAYARRPNYKPANPLRFAQTREIDLFRQIGSRFGATSMIIRRSGIEKLLKFLLKYQIYLPYDIELAAPEDIHLYTVLSDIISNLPDALSNNGKPI